MKCPQCNGVYEIIDSRSVNNLKRRRRRCLECGFAETTYEIPKKEYDDYRESKEIIGKLLKITRKYEKQV